MKSTNKFKKVSLVLTLILLTCMQYTNAQSWNITGNAGINPNSNYIGTKDTIDLVFRTNKKERGRILGKAGKWQFGTSANNAQIDSLGKLTFKGKGDYLVGKNRYVFRFSGDTKYGLFFNSTVKQYEFRDGNASPVFIIDANTGQGTFTGDARINGITVGRGGASVISNTAIGEGALFSNAGGFENTANGNHALYTNTIGFGNTANGYYSLFNNSTGAFNIAFGGFSLYANSTGNSNTANGYTALYQNTIGNNNTATGNAALNSNTSGNSNVALGISALYANTDRSNLVAVGDSSLYYNGINAVNDYDATGNTAVGSKALFSNTTGYFNTANGTNSLYLNTTGFQNTANGYKALYSNTNGNRNTANGYLALYSNTSGYYNTANGLNALYSNTIGIFNTADGVRALYSNTTGSSNTAIGFNALYTNTTGNFNTTLGYYSDVSTSNLNNAMALGYFAAVNASNKVQVGNTNVTVIGGQVGWSTFSDGRFKKNIKQNVPGLEFINKLNPVTYTLEIKKFDQFLGKKDSIINSKESQEGYAIGEKKIRTGFIAQEVEETAKKIGYDFDGVNKPQNEKDNYSLVYADFVPSLVKAVQELSKENEEFKNEIAELKAMVANLAPGKNGSTAEAENKISLSSVSLEQNVPNPLAGSTSIGYFIPSNMHNAQLIVTDMSGKLIKQITLQNGKGNITIDASTLSAGTYNYSLMVNGKVVASKKMVVSH